VEWALWIQRAPDDQLLAAAGELERVRMRTRGDPRLVPAFVRLFEVALASGDATADQAGGIAVRCLHRLGATHLLRSSGPRVRERTDRPLMSEELDRALRIREDGPR
jgi:hypothetical protein